MYYAIFFSTIVLIFIPGHPRVIVHIDIDCFYAQVEMIRNPSLRDKPLGKNYTLILTVSLFLCQGGDDLKPKSEKQTIR